MATKKELINLIKIAKKVQTARPGKWTHSKQARYKYCLEIVEALEDGTDIPINSKNYSYNQTSKLIEILLNGAEDWQEYSHEGNSLIYDEDIYKRLYTPTERKRLKGGFYNCLYVQGVFLEKAVNTLLRIIANKDKILKLYHDIQKKQ